MNLDSLTHSNGEWLRGNGPESDIVLSSRIRLARNLSSFPFPNRATPHQKAEIEAQLRERLASLDFSPRLAYLQLPTLPLLDRQMLVERQLISRELANTEGARGVALSETETISVMVNEEDHLRLQVIRSGLALHEAWQEIDRLDDAIESRVAYAFSEEFGYLTACPTNVGTGMRASVLMHLPAVSLVKHIDKVFRSLQKINLAVRGLYGEGSRSAGDFYQISNQVTLGKSETTILNELNAVVPEIIRYERNAREVLARDSRQSLLDSVSRAHGTLRSATVMTLDETMELLSRVRLGVHMGLVDDITIEGINELFIHAQPAHLQKLAGGEIESTDRDAARARYLRARLRDMGSSIN
jgi:protein arginine kinase